MRCVVIAASIAASGCVSSGTWQVIHDAEERIAERPETEAGRAEARDCVSVASIAIERARGLDAPRARARAALARARAEGALPAPSTSFEVWDFPIGDPSRGDREGMYMLSVEQAIPPLDALDGRARAEAEEASAMLADLDERTREIHAMVHHACVERDGAAAEIAALDAALATLARAIELASARRAAAGDPLVELARMELERGRMLRMRAQLEAERARTEEELEAIAGTALDLPEPSALTEPDADGEADEPAVDALLARALEARGELRAANARARAAEARARAAEAEATVPEVMLRATYMQMPQERAGLGAMIGLRLPFLWSGERDAAEAARQDARAELDEVAWRERALRIELAQHVAMLRGARRALAAIREHERPAAERVLESALLGYAQGTVDATAWLDALRAVREIAVEEARALAAVAHAHADLDEVVGARVSGGAR